jgi:uncharacterized protein YpmS
MEVNKKSTAKYWMWCFIWLAIMIVMLILPSARPFFWLALPGVVTYFALAMDIM